MANISPQLSGEHVTVPIFLSSLVGSTFVCVILIAFPDILFLPEWMIRLRGNPFNYVNRIWKTLRRLPFAFETRRPRGKAGGPSRTKQRRFFDSLTPL